MLPNRTVREGHMAGKPSRGLADVVVASTAVSDIDGRDGRLSYRGYDIGQLAGTVSFEEVAYLLQPGTPPGRGGPPTAPSSPAGRPSARPSGPACRPWPGPSRRWPPCAPWSPWPAPMTPTPASPSRPTPRPGGAPPPGCPGSSPPR